ncbi:MAG: protein-disulfide reductase DsbD [Betaproteobacteria bacterium]|nr:protein-disulfide reductase DsbD [Betaproteobacteria bacterium]
MNLARLFAWLLALCACFAHAAPVKEEELLEPEKAFRMSVRALDDRSVEVSFAIADGYYLYRERFKFEADAAPGGAPFKFGTADFPAGIRKKDEFFGEVETYRKQVTVMLPVERFGSGDTLKLAVTSQGCADVGVCYVPMQTKVSLRLAAGSTASGAPSLTQGPDSVSPSSYKAARLSTTASDFDIVALFESGSFWLVLASFLGFGLLLAFTPCMLPMIPILSGIIAGEGRDLNKLRALILSSAYVLGMAVTYAIAGVAAAYSGTLIAAALQNPWVLSAFALVFVWLALSMFGFHDLQLPAFLHDRLSSTHHKLRGGHVASVAGMGVLSAVIVSPCVAAPLAGALLYISQTKDVVLGGGALFAMALGMGAPLVVVGVSEGAFLPKSGPWMNGVKKFFGVLLLAVAVWIVWPVISPLINGSPAAHGLKFERVNTIAELNEKLRAPGKPVLLDFYADWCVSCKEMEALTFTDARVKEKMNGMLLLQADVTANSAEHKELLKRFSLFGPPGIIFFDARGAEIRGLRVIGYQKADQFLTILGRDGES